MNNCDFLASLHELLLFGCTDATGDNLVSIVGGDSHAENTSARVHLSDNGDILGAGEDLDLWSILGDESSEFASVGQDDDQGDVLLI